MIKIGSLEFSEKKNIFFALLKFYGIGHKRAYSILSFLDIDRIKNINELTEGEIKKVNEFLLKREKTIGVELKNKVKTNIKDKITLFSYKGSRHKQKLPVRGQRTRTNARTAKKNKV